MGILRHEREKRGDMLPTAQRTICLLWWLMLLLCFMPLAGRGRDAQDNHVALGFGLEACQTFLQARSNGLDMAYRHWLTGYLTAVNKLTNNKQLLKNLSRKGFVPRRGSSHSVT